MARNERNKYAVPLEELEAQAHVATEAMVEEVTTDRSTAVLRAGPPLLLLWAGGAIAHGGGPDGGSLDCGLDGGGC